MCSYKHTHNSAVHTIDRNGEDIFLVVPADVYSINYKPTVIRITNENLDEIDGLSTFYKTDMGKALINNYMINSTEDVYISVGNLPQNSSGHTNGMTLNPLVNPIDDKGEFNTSNARGKSYFSQLVPFSNFDYLQTREGVESNTFVLIDDDVSNMTEAEQAETVGHEFLHVDYFKKGISGGEHHDKMGEGTDDKTKDLPKLKEQINDVLKEE